MKGSYLKGNIICALPQLKDIFFSRSIIYITHHNKDGAVGIVLNYKVLNIKGSELFRKLDIKGVNNNLDNDDIKDDASIGLITGPESGFSEEERSLLIDKNVSIKLLGNHTLRAETAAIVGLTLARNFLGKL